MAFTGNYMCTSFKQQLLQGQHNFTNATGDTFKIALYTNSASFTAATTDYTATNEVANSGSYAAGGGTLTNVTPTTSGTTAFTDFADITFTSATITARGALIKIRVDMLSERPHAMTNYMLQGTQGCYESARSPQEQHRIWLSELCPDKNEWMDLSKLESTYLPKMWCNPPEAALRAGHGGGDYFEVLDFVQSVIEGTPCPIGIHEAMDMTLPGLISQSSVTAGGAWLDVPDSRVW